MAIGNARLKSSTCTLSCDYIPILVYAGQNWQNSKPANDLTALSLVALHSGPAIANGPVYLLAIRTDKRRSRALDMRWIVAITAILVCTGWFSCQFDVPIGGSVHRASITEWRRTVDGWEKVAVRSNEVSVLTDHIASVVPGDIWVSHPHPLVLSLLLAMLSALALVAFSPTNSVPNLTRTNC